MKNLKKWKQYNENKSKLPREDKIEILSNSSDWEVDELNDMSDAELSDLWYSMEMDSWLDTLQDEELNKDEVTIGGLINYLENNFDKDSKIYLTDGIWIGPTVDDKLKKLIFKSGPKRIVYLVSNIGRK